MSCADGGTGDHLRPKAPCAGPLARWHKPQLVCNQKSIGQPMSFARTRCVSRNMRKKLCGAFFGLLGSLANSDQNAHIHLARTYSQSLTCTVAHSYRFKNTVPPEPYDQRSVRAVPIQNGCRPDDFCFHRSGGMVFLNLNMCAKVYVHD